MPADTGRRFVLFEIFGVDEFSHQLFSPLRARLQGGRPIGEPPELFPKFVRESLFPGAEFIGDEGSQLELQGKAGFRQHCAGTHAEMFPAAPAAVGHGFVVFTLTNVDAATMPAGGKRTAPATLFEVEPRGIFVWEALKNSKVLRMPAADMIISPVS